MLPRTLLAHAATVLGVLALGTGALATDVVSNHLTLTWNRAAGPVTAYAVYVSRNGAPYSPIPDVVTPAGWRFASISGDTGETLRFRVKAFSQSVGAIGPASPQSLPFRLVPPEPPPWTGSILFNGGFEGSYGLGDYETLYSGNPVIPGWTISGHSVDWIQDYWAPAEGRRSLDLAGLGGGAVSQTFSTQVGRFYYVYFALAGNPDGGFPTKSLRISAAGDSRVYGAPSEGDLDDLGWIRPEPFLFQATSWSTTLTIENHLQNGPYGAALDDVVVRPAAF